MSSESPQVLSKVPYKLIGNVQNNPSQPSSVAITACTTSNGDVNCYLRTSEGQVLQHCQEQRMTQFPARMIDCNAPKSGSAHVHMPQTDGWKPGLVRKCDPGSQLSCLAWGGTKQTLFYQLHNTIREARFDNHWYDTNFLQADVMPGTRIAAVCTYDGKRTVVFFQDSAGFLCCQRAWNWNWEMNASRLVKAAPNTAIAAVIVDLPKNRAADTIRVYYQDEYLILREHATDDFGAKWVIGNFVEDPLQFVVSMAAALLYADGPQLSVLYHDPRNLCINEKRWKANKWTKLADSWDTRSRAVFTVSREAYVTACIHTLDETSIVNVIHVGPDAVIDQHIWRAQLGWLKPSFVEYQPLTEGDRIGPWKGKRFDDRSFPSNAWQKMIKAIRIRGGNTVNGICLDFADGTSTAWHGGFGGRIRPTFELEAGEDIIQVQVYTDNEYIRALQFRTSKGRASEAFGTSSAATFETTWEAEDKILAGFSGTFGKLKPTEPPVLTGLQPLWRESLHC